MTVAVENDLGLTAQQIAIVRAPFTQAGLLPSQVYSDPHIFRLERERIFRRTWLKVCHISEIPNAGDFVARNLVGEAVMALREKDGSVRVMSNVCRHRNMVLTQGSGNCKSRIMCPYHGWTYGLDGRLLAAPFMDQTEDFVRRDITLPTFHHEIWHGFVFVNFDENAVPLAEQLAPFEAIVGPYRFEDMEYFEMRRTTVPWNWKVSLENFSEAYHQPWVHAQTAETSFPANLAEYLDTNNNYSIFTLRQESNDLLQTFRPHVEGLSDAMRRVVSVFNIYPYMHALVDPATPLFLDFNITSENEHEMIWSLLMPKGSKAQPNILDDVKAFEGFLAPIIAEDVDICTGVSRGVSSTFTTQGRLSYMEKPLYQFHNWWLDHMLPESAAFQEAAE